MTFECRSIRLLDTLALALALTAASAHFMKLLEQRLCSRSLVFAPLTAVPTCHLVLSYLLYLYLSLLSFPQYCIC